jgi:hypothetical protein
MEQLVSALGGQPENEAKNSNLCIMDAEKDKKIVATIKAMKKVDKPIITSMFLILDGILKQDLVYENYII